MPTSGCCCGPCKLYEDDYGTDTSVPSGLTVVSGSWSMDTTNSGDHRLTTASANAIITIDGLSLSAAHVVIEYSLSVGDAFRVYLGYLDDENWLAVEVFFPESGIKRTRYISCAAGVETVANETFVSINAYTSTGAFLVGGTGRAGQVFCLVDGALSATEGTSGSFSSTPMPHTTRTWDMAITPPGGAVGFGTGAMTTGIKVRKVTVHENYTACVEHTDKCLVGYDVSYMVNGAMAGDDGWEIISGTWDRATSGLTGDRSIIAASAGMIINTMVFESADIQYLSASPYYHALFGLLAATEWRMILGYTDTDNYVYLRKTGIPVRYTLCERVAGTETDLSSQYEFCDEQVWYDPASGDLAAYMGTTALSRPLQTVSAPTDMGLRGGLSIPTWQTNAGWYSLKSSGYGVLITCAPAVGTVVNY